MKILAIGTSYIGVYPQKVIIPPSGEAFNIVAQLTDRADLQVFLMGVIGQDIYAENILRSVNRFAIDAKSN